MWKDLSLRMRLLLPLAAMFAAVVLAGGIALQHFASEQLMEENEPSQRSALGVSRALNLALATSTNPEQTLEAFVGGPGTSDAIRFRRTTSSDMVSIKLNCALTLRRTFEWLSGRTTADVPRRRAAARMC
jgi:two-component system, NarL family, sensor histidine kinase UhpB